MRVLIGYDGSPAAERALKELQGSGLPEGTEARVVTATMPWPMPGLEARGESPFGAQAREIEKQALRAATALADRAARRLGKRMPTWSVTGEAILGRPAEAILSAAGRWRADLIVVGAHARSAFGRLVLGSVSQRVLHHARGDVRIVRGAARAPRGLARRVLVAVDGSPGSDRAVAAVAARTWPRGTRARVIAVVDWRVSPSPLLKSLPDASGRKAVDSLIEAKCEEAVRVLRGAGLEASYAVLFGVPSRVVVDECAAWHADAVFLGRRGLNAVRRFLVGSVSSAVAAHAPCTVELIRGAEPPAARPRAEARLTAARRPARVPPRRPARRPSRPARGSRPRKPA